MHAYIIHNFGREQSSTLIWDLCKHHLRPKLKENGEEKKSKIRWTVIINNVYWREALNKMKKSAIHCQVIHYRMLANTVPTYNGNWRKSIIVNRKFHRPANRKWTAHEATAKNNFSNHFQSHERTQVESATTLPAIKVLKSYSNLRL